MDQAEVRLTGRDIDRQKRWDTLAKVFAILLSPSEASPIGLGGTTTTIYIMNNNNNKQ